MLVRGLGALGFKGISYFEDKRLSTGNNRQMKAYRVPSSEDVSLALRSNSAVLMVTSL